MNGSATAGNARDAGENFALAVTQAIGASDRNFQNVQSTGMRLETPSESTTEIRAATRDHAGVRKI